MEMEKPDGTLLRSAEGGRRPVPSLAPRFPHHSSSLRRVTGTTARPTSKPRGAPRARSSTTDPRGCGRSWLPCVQLLSTSILPSQGHQPAPSRTPGSGSSRHRAGASPCPAPRSWRELGASGHPWHPSPAARQDQPRTPYGQNSASFHPAPQPSVAGDSPRPPCAVPLATWLLPPAWITSLSVFFNFS